MATIEIAHGHITVADLNDGHTPSIDVGADGRLVIDGVPKGPSLKGEDAEPVARYEIVPSDNSIMRDFKGALSPARLTARVFRDTGVAMQEVTLGGSNSLRYSIDGGTEQTYSPASGIATGGAKQKITLTFYVGVIRWASLDVPVHGIRAQLDSSGNLTIGEAVVNVKGPKPVLSLNAQHQLVADGELVSSTVLKGADGITPEIDPTTKRWKIGGTLTQVKAEGTDGQPGTPGTPGKDFKYTDFTAAQLDALQSGVKSKIDTSAFRSDLGGLIKGDVKTLLKGDSAFVAATKGEPGTPGTNGTNGKDFKYTDFTAAQLDALQSGVKSKIDTSSFRSDIKTLLKGDSAFVAATKGATGAQGFGVKVVEWVGSTTLATAKGWVGKSDGYYTCKSSDTLTSLRVGDTVHILIVLSDQGSKKGYVVGTCSQKSGTQVSVASVEAFIFGDKGDTGPQGPKGDKPIVTLGTDGYLVIDGTKQSTLLKGKDGKDGTNGTNGTNGLNWAAGKMLYTDPNFAESTNGCMLYNNASNGVTTVTRSTGDWPSSSGYGLVIKNTGAASPGLGGFTFQHQSKKGHIYVIRLIANIPSGHNIIYTTNAVGNGGTYEWFTPRTGVGLYREYVVKVTCGWTGTFSTLGFFYLDGTPGTSASPLTWYVSYATIFDITETDGYVKSISNVMTVAASKLTQAQVDARVVAGVPAWARASSKPSYSYTEITGRVTKVSELTNDSGYKTESQINTIINGKGFATTSALNSVQSSIPTKVSQLSNDANYTRERLIANRGDFQHIVILLWKDAELAAHRIQGKLFTTGGGVNRHQVVDLDLWFSRWSSSGYDYSFRFDAYGQATPFELVTCTYQGATWWGIRHTSSQAIAIYFQGTDSGVSWNTVHYYTSNTNAVANSEINSSILSKSALVYNIVNKVGAKLDTATFNTEKTALQNAIAAKTDLATVKSNCYVKTEIDTKVTALNTAIGTKLTQAQVDARVTSIVPAWSRASSKPGYSFSELTGTATAAQIPSLDASKITAGTLGADRIPSLNASKITAGTLGADRIPTLAIAKVSGLQTALDGKTTLAAVKALGYKDEAGVKALLTWSNVSSKPTLFSGKYSDLTGKPTIPSKVSELTNDSGYLYLSNGCVTDTAGTCSVLPYAAKSHTHTGYASSSHNHDTVYAAKSHKHNTLEATYSGSGGKQPPNYIGYNSLRSCMSNEEVNGNTQYKNWIYINAYSGADVGGTTAIGFNRQTMAAYLMRSEANASTWAEKAELLGTHNFFICHMLVRWTSSAISSGGYKGSFPTSGLTRDANGFHFTANVDWGLTANGGNAFFIVNAIVTPIPITAYMAGNTVYVKWNGTLADNVRGNVSLTILRCP